jgi:hypothetical protein
MNDLHYHGSQQRTFAEALLHLLEEEYRLVGSRRVLELLVADVQQLVAAFYPCPEHLASGWMVYTGTRASGGKAYPGQTAGAHELVTLAWPVLLPEDVAAFETHSDTTAARRAACQQRLVRIIEYGCCHPQGPVLLTLADLAVMTGIPRRDISRLLQEAREQTGKALPTKGYYFDQGVQPSHKVQIIALYEQGVDEAEIARRSQHDPKSVGAYIRDYERVKLLLRRATPVDQIPLLIDLRPSVVQAYAEMIEQYHPDLIHSSKTAPAPLQSEKR